MAWPKKGPISDAWVNADERQKERFLNLLVAAGLFMASLIFIEAIRWVASLELGGHDPLPGSLQGLCRWDCQWYGTIANAGYHLKPMFHANGDAANWAFFPALPIVASVLRAVTGVSTSQALVMTSRLFFFASIFIFIGYSQRFLGRKGGWLAGAAF